MPSITCTRCHRSRPARFETDGDGHVVEAPCDCVGKRLCVDCGEPFKGGPKALRCRECKRLWTNTRERRGYHKRLEDETYRKAYREDRKRYMREWRKKNPDKVRRQAIRSHAKRAATSMRYYKKNREKILAAQKERYKRDPEKHRAAAREHMRMLRARRKKAA